MKKGFLTCGGSMLVGIVVIVVVISFAFNSFIKSFSNDMLNEMGFNSQAEFDSFSEIFSENISSTVFPVIYQSSDLEVVKQTLQNCVMLDDNSPLYLTNGLLNIPAIDQEGNASLTDDICFEPKLYACFLDFIYKSVVSDAKKSQLSDIRVLSYELNSAENHRVVLKLDTDVLKNSLKDYGKALPSDLYIQYNYDIIYENNSVKFQNLKLKFNQLSEENNTTALNFLKVVLGNDCEKIFGDILQAIVNSFANSLNANTLFSELTISMEA